MYFLARRKYRRGKDRRLALMEFALAVEPERLVEPRHAFGMARQKRVVERVKTRDPAVAAMLRRLEAVQHDRVGRRPVVGVVGVEFQFDVGLVGAHAGTRQGGPPG